MEECNVQIYSEIGKGRPSAYFQPTIVYKARLKNSLEFAAAKCCDIARMEEIKNAVGIIHNIKHQNIVEFYSWFQAENKLYEILEYCPGGSLTDLLERDVRLPENIIRILGADILAGLNHLHKNNVIFSNFDTSNFFLDENGIVKLGDFTRSIFVGERLNLQDIDVEYMETFAPEMFRGQQPTFSSDLYSFGCLLYKMAFGEAPFTSEEQMDLENKIKTAQPNPLPYFSNEFNDMVLKLLIKEPEKRLNWKELINHMFWRDILSSREDADEIVPPDEEIIQKEAPVADSSIDSFESESDDDVNTRAPTNALSMSLRSSSLSLVKMDKVENIRDMLEKHPFIATHPIVFNQNVESFNLAKYDEAAMPVTYTELVSGQVDAMLTFFKGKDVVKRLSPVITFAINSAKTRDVATALCTKQFIEEVMILAGKTKHPSIAAAHCILCATILQNTSSVSDNVLTKDVLAPIEKLLQSQNLKILKKVVCLLGTILSTAAKYQLNIPNFVIPTLINELKNSDEVIRHYSIKSITNALIDSYSLDDQLLESALSKFDSTTKKVEDSSNLTTSYIACLTSLYRNRRPPEFVISVVKSAIVKLGTPAIIAISLGAATDTLSFAKDEILSAFSKSNGDLKLRCLMAMTISHKSPSDFVNISERFFSYLDRIQYDSPMVYEGMCRWLTEYIENIICTVSSQHNYNILSIVSDALCFRTLAPRLYTPKLDKLVKNAIKLGQFNVAKSDLLLVIASTALILQLTDQSIISNISKAIESQIKEVRFNAAKLFAISYDQGSANYQTLQEFKNQILPNLDFLLNDDKLIADQILAASKGALMEDESLLSKFLEPNIVQAVFAKIGSSGYAVDVAILLINNLSSDEIVDMKLIPSIIRGMDTKSKIRQGVQLLKLTLNRLENASTIKSSRTKMVRSIDALSTMGARCASMILEYPEAADCLASLIRLFTPQPGQNDVVIESAFAPFATALTDGFKKPECNKSLKIVVDSLKDSALSSSMKLKLKTNNKLMNALKNASTDSATSELKASTDAALKAIKQ